MVGPKKKTKGNKPKGRWISVNAREVFYSGFGGQRGGGNFPTKGKRKKHPIGHHFKMSSGLNLTSGGRHSNDKSNLREACYVGARKGGNETDLPLSFRVGVRGSICNIMRGRQLHNVGVSKKARWRPGRLKLKKKKSVPGVRLGVKSRNLNGCQR